MAMADRRPIGMPLASVHASPAFNTPKKHASSKENDIGSYNGSVSPTELSPNSRSISPDSLMNPGPGNAKKGVSSNSSRGSTPPSNGTNGNIGFQKRDSFSGASSNGFSKKLKAVARVPIATGISTTIPVTGEKPKPEQQGDASLEDDVLFAIFLILYEKDLSGQGMTVKQICDVLVERHPEMAQLSSKTSNLVSAKLNAYVKRVEKGDSNLKYALSREWADASPKRMVYVYRGLLAKDFQLHVKGSGDSVGKNSPNSKPVSAPFKKEQSPAFPADSFEAAKQSALAKPRRQTMYDLGISRHSFADSSESSNLFVPYSSAPVAANMGKSNAEEAKEEVLEENTTKDSELAEGVGAEIAVSKPAGLDAPASESKKFANDSDFDLDDFEVFNDTDEDDDMFGGFSSETFSKKSGKRSKSMSHLTVNKKAKFVTAAAAAPRVPRTPCAHNPQAAAAAAALHAAALKAIAAANVGQNDVNSDMEVESHAVSSNSSAGNGSCFPRPRPRSESKSNWAHAVKSGFLTQEIGAPEDVSLSDLDKLFA